MKSASLGTVSGLVSLVAVGALYVKIDRLEERITPTEYGRAAVSRSAPEPEPVVVARAAPRQSGAAEPEEDEATGGRLGRGSVEERVARLESLERDRRREEARGEARPGPVLRMPRFARSVDDLSKTLELTPTQTDRVRQSVERAKRLIEQVLSIPDESGTSPLEQRREKRAKMKKALESGDAGGILGFALDSRAYRSRAIPGRNTTYGAEIDRIKRESHEEIAGILDPRQEEEFEELETDALYGEGGGITTSVYVAGDSVVEEGR